MPTHTWRMSDVTNLSNQFLIAMPGMADPNFSRTVTFLFQHSDQGAAGIVINRPMKMQLSEVFLQLKLPSANPPLDKRFVLQGGPMQIEQGFVIHRRMDDWEYSVLVSDTLQITTSRDILASMARGDGPESALVALGYAGWAPGQLESELAANAWLTVACDEKVLFDLPYEERWHAAGRLLGIDLMNLSGSAGHA